MSWVITRRRINPFQAQPPGCSFFYSYDACDAMSQDVVTVIAEGYIIPVLDIQDQYEGIHGPELVLSLMKVHGDAFIRKIKGNFSLVIIANSGFRVFNDIHGMGRFFFRQAGDDFIIADRIKPVQNYFSSEPDNENIALYCLTEHFIPGMTAFKGIMQSMPASMVTYDGTLKKSIYRDPGELLAIGHEKHGIPFYAERWKNLIRGYANESESGNMTLTLTGGSDSRMVLAGLLAAGITPRTFTYGDRASADAVIADRLAVRLGIDHALHSFPALTAGWQKETFLSLAGFGDTLVNLHRAHRYQAARDERDRNQDTDLLFTGLMGGEYLRGPRYDGYIISEYFREVTSGRERLNIALRMLTGKSFEINCLDRQLFSDRLEQMSELFRGGRKEREFRLAHYIYGCSHHYQDTRIFSRVFRKVASPFMDQDFLEMIASSGDICFRRSGMLINLFRPSHFQVMVTHRLLPEVSDIPYGKRGLFTAGDLVEKPYRYFGKRLSSVIRPGSFPPSFRHGDWMKEFVRGELNQLSPEVSALFNVNEIAGRLLNAPAGMSEKGWHYFTNPVNLSQIFK